MPNSPLGFHKSTGHSCFSFVRKHYPQRISPESKLGLEPPGERPWIGRVNHHASRKLIGLHQTSTPFDITPLNVTGFCRSTNFVHWVIVFKMMENFYMGCNMTTVSQTDLLLFFLVDEDFVWFPTDSPRIVTILQMDRSTYMCTNIATYTLAVTHGFVHA